MRRPRFRGLELPVLFLLAVAVPATVVARGLIYGADRAGTGLHIMSLTGDAAAVAKPQS